MPHRDPPVLPPGLGGDLLRVGQPTQSDREVAILAAAYVDEMMRLALVPVFRRFGDAEPASATAAKELFSAPAGGLSSFSNRLNALTALGIVTEQPLRKAAMSLSKIRNQAAHLHEPFSFEDESRAAQIALLNPTLLFQETLDSARARGRTVQDLPDESGWGGFAIAADDEGRMTFAVPFPSEAPDGNREQFLGAFHALCLRLSYDASIGLYGIADA